jgi:hypothetical protein
MKLDIRRLRPVLLAVPVAGASLALAGCSSVLNNPDKVVAKIILENTGVKVSSVTCPSDIPLKKGHTFTCTVKVNGQAHTVTVDETSTTGSGAILHIIKVT